MDEQERVWYNDERLEAKQMELRKILEKFVQSGWDLIAVPSSSWLEDNGDREVLRKAIEQADEECGSCGCELDPLYKRALELL